MVKNGVYIHIHIRRGYKRRNPLYVCVIEEIKKMFCLLTFRQIDIYQCMGESLGMLPVDYSQNSVNDGTTRQVSNVVSIDLFWSITCCKHVNTL